MKESDKKEKLVHLLDKGAFDPILKESPEQFTGEKRAMFEDVRRSTESEKNRFHHYGSAEEVKKNYLSDLSSRTGKKKNEELEELGLPKLPDLKEKFLKLCDELEV